MKIIQKQAKLVTKILGNQKLNISLKYRMLGFCLFKKVENGCLVFNNLTKELIYITEQELSVLEDGNYNVSDIFTAELIKKWFLVPENHDDIKLSKEITALARQLSGSRGINLYNIVTTTACNARCFYCFEAGISVKTMSEKTCIDVGSYIVKNYDGQQVKINWFGGEPLCNKNAINKISDYLSQKNINFISAMTTNGYLFDDEDILKANKLWKLKNVQITLDGMEETYNKVKNYKNVNGSPFLRVIDNIGKLLHAGISVNIRLNVDKYNINEMYGLVDYLYDLYGKLNGFTVYAHLLFEETGFIKISRTEEDRKFIAKSFNDFRAYIDNLGIWGRNKYLERKIKTNFCIADSGNGFLISPEGKLGKCERSVDKDFTGDIYSEKIARPFEKYCEPISRCYNCAYFPSCMRLKECPNCQNECYEYEQQLHLMDLETQMLNVYEKYLTDNKK